MMKTIIKKIIEENEPATSYIRRLSDEKAKDLVKDGDWLYSPKQQWKTEVRDANKKEESTQTKKKKKKGTKKDE